MTVPIIIIDAGPALTFYAAGHEDLLIQVVASTHADLQMPEIVRTEVHQKSSSDSVFARAAPTLEQSIAAGDIVILNDEQDHDGQLADRAARVRQAIGVATGRSRTAPSSKDLGESMVLARAQLLQRDGVKVFILIEDEGAKRIAHKLEIPFLDTEAILVKAAKIGLVKDRGEMRKIWERLRLFDSLPPWSHLSHLNDKSIYGEQVS